MSEVDKIGDDLTSRMPDVQSHVVDAESKPPSKEGPTDKDGRGFDPSLHEVDHDGKPRLKKDGTLSMARGTKKGYKRSKVVDTSQIPDNPGKAIAESIFAIGQLVGGEDFIPIEDAERGINERKTMTSAWEGYCEQKEITDFPPGIALAMAMLGYVVPRFYMDKTKSRFAKGKEWLAGKIGEWKAKRAA